MMQEKIQRCAIYIRVSTAEQAMHGKSLEAQTEYLTNYAHEHNMVIVGVFADEGKTARKNFKDRKAIKALLKLVKEDAIDIIIFWKMDRWFRNVSDFYKVQDILDAHQVKWIATAEPNMNLDTREGRLNLNIMLSINQNETDTTSERIRFVNEASVRQGKVVSGAQPFGFMIKIFDDGKKKVVKDPDTESIVDEFYEYYFVHQSKRGAFVYLCNKYGPVITMRQVEKLCNNTMYYGRYRDNYNYCPAYITEEQYNQLQEINKRNIKLYMSYEETGEIYLFTGLIPCPICGRPLSANRTTKNSHTGKPFKRAYRYYRCQNWIYKKTCTYSKLANEATIEKYLLDHIEEAKRQYLDEVIIYNSISEKAPVEKKKNDKEKLLKELDRLNNMYQKGRISEDKYDAEYDCINNELKAITEIPIPRIKRPVEELETILCEDWKNMYDKLSRENKRAFWRSLIAEIRLNEDSSFVKSIELI